MSTYDKAHFDRLYEAERDPWHFRDSTYEAEKYRATIDALADERYANCLELGCSIGVLTSMLAERCERIVAVDTSAAALSEARVICSDPNVEFRQAYLPDGDLGRDYDLIVASEVLYFLDGDSLTQLSKRLAEIALPGATCIGVHWTGATDYPLSGDEATALLEREANLIPVSHIRTAKYRLDVWIFP